MRKSINALKKAKPPKNMIFEVTGGQWPPIWKMKKTGEGKCSKGAMFKFLSKSDNI